MVLLFLTGVMTMMTIESAFNVIWRVRKARPIAQRILVYWAIITLGSDSDRREPLDLVVSVRAVHRRSARPSRMTPVIEFGARGRRLAADGARLHDSLCLSAELPWWSGAMR